MNAIDRIFGPRADLAVEELETGTSRHDALAVERYESMLRSAPRTTIVQAHVEAFEKLTPSQLDLLFERFTAAATNNAERPTDAQPRNLALSAVRTESRAPGTISNLLRVDEAPAEPTCTRGRSLLQIIARYAMSSNAWASWGGVYMGAGIWDDGGEWW